jgi:hypothetical protein
MSFYVLTCVKNNLISCALQNILVLAKYSNHSSGLKIIYSKVNIPALGKTVCKLASTSLLTDLLKSLGSGTSLRVVFVANSRRTGSP